MVTERRENEHRLRIENKVWQRSYKFVNSASKETWPRPGVWRRAVLPGLNRRLTYDTVLLRSHQFHFDHYRMHILYLLTITIGRCGLV